MSWDRRLGSKRQQGIITPKRPKSRRQRNAANRIGEKVADASARSERAAAWLKEQMGLK
jgi:hypothetical protein